MGSLLTARDRYVWSRRLNGVLHPLTIAAYLRASPWKTPLLPFKMTVVAAKAGGRAVLDAVRTACLRSRLRGLGCSKVGDDVRPIAFYLPQFHAIPENDVWWGKGFTEWTNVRAARPLYAGHRQPQTPHADIGYYDLSEVAVMRRQAETARRYGLFGFCFYYYRFKDGKRLLERPLENWLAARDIDFPFCCCWANENWSRTWTGGDREVLMQQDYGLENMRGLIEEMCGIFSDPRYIRVEGKPVLLVYRPEIVPEMQQVARLWRDAARAAGFPGLHLVAVQNFSQADPRTMGLDAAAGFAGFHARAAALHLGGLTPEDCRVDNALRYADVVAASTDPREPDYPCYRSVCPNWDNTPRRGCRGTALLGATPAAFRRFLARAVALTLVNRKCAGNRFVFINAWNEWAESAHLEPDADTGYANLEVLRDVLAHDSRTLAEEL